MLNHSIFKGLLFLGSGAVLHATGLRDIDRLGGLIRVMPYTAFFFIGSAAISALPPLNGFVSEWLTFQAILASPEIVQPSLKFLIPVIGVMLALIVVSLAENARIPVDNPSTHLELTMIHEAMVLEYSGRHLALIEMASATKLLLYVSLIICLFFPFGIAYSEAFIGAQLLAIVIGLAKVAVLGVLLAIGETMVSKMRLFRVAEFLGGALVGGLLAMIYLFVFRGL